MVMSLIAHCQYSSGTLNHVVAHMSRNHVECHVQLLDSIFFLIQMIIANAYVYNLRPGLDYENLFTCDTNDGITIYFSSCK